MARLRKRKIGKKQYYYLEHSYKLKGKVKGISKYLGRKKPDNLEDLKREIEFQAMRGLWTQVLKGIKKEYSKEQKTLPKSAKKKMLEHFMVDFIYNSNKIEGSSLTYKDTAGLFIHGTTPQDKPVKDVKEAEGHRKAFSMMLQENKNISFERILKWHNAIFRESDPVIAGKIRLHKIIVTGSRATFPHPETLKDELKIFFSWCKKERKKWNPVEFSSLAHLKFVSIHPFTDGNGRISRLLANFILNKANYPMFNIKFGDRKGYYHNLETSQIWNDDKHFVRFFVKKYIKEYRKLLREK
jgi:Fic family protein